MTKLISKTESSTRVSLSIPELREICGMNDPTKFGFRCVGSDVSFGPDGVECRFFLSFAEIFEKSKRLRSEFGEENVMFFYAFSESGEFVCDFVHSSLLEGKPFARKESNVTEKYPSTVTVGSRYAHMYFGG